MRQGPSYLVYIFLLFLAVMPGLLMAQDIHFSQYHMSPLNLNPANTGHMKQDIRFALNFRNQWQSVTEPYRTSSASVDSKFDLANRSFAGGILINQDKTGDSRFGTFQIMLSAAKHFLISDDSTFQFGFGIQGGLVNRSIKYGDLFFDNQFNGDVFDESLPNNERFANDGFFYADLSAGIVASYRLSERTDLSAGFATFHLNKPKQSFFDNAEIKLDPRVNLTLDLAYELDSDFDLIPSLLFMNQGKFRETLAGIRGVYQLENQPGRQIAVSCGAFARIKDALVISTGMDYNQWRLGVSYDFNTSDLQVASNRKGGLEFALIYLISKVKTPNNNRKICPVY